jgi:hypothetical protein
MMLNVDVACARARPAHHENGYNTTRSAGFGDGRLRFAPTTRGLEAGAPDERKHGAAR